jgi:hypothetical protein
MNSEPLSESTPRMGNGNGAMTWLMASNTQMAALFLTERLIVQPVAISVTVRVKQNSPLELRPSGPTRSISTKPGMSSVHSAQVRMGIWDLSNVPGLVCERPRDTSLSRSGARCSVDRRRAHGHEQCRLVVAQDDVAVAAQQRHHRPSIGARRLPAGARVSIQHVARQVIMCGGNFGSRDRRASRS